MIAYKALQRLGNKLVSYNVTGPLRYEKPLLSLYYYPGETTYPKIPNSGLFVFDSLENAREFMEGDNPDYYELWTCECPKLTPFQACTNVNVVELYWKDPKKYQTYGYKGSCITPHLTLLERVL